MIVKAVNDIVEYNGLMPTLLIFETFPHITNNDTSTLSITDRVKAINIVITEVIKLHVKR